FLFYHLVYPLTVKFAYLVGAIDTPNERKIHKNPIPRIGGLGIYLAFTFSVIRNFQFSKEILAILIASSLIFLIGLIDDIKPLSAIWRLFFQILASLIVVVNGISIKFPLSWGFIGDFLSFVVSILWIVGIVNTFNFIDGIDGLAGFLTLIISLIFLIIVVNTSQYHVMFITSSLCGAVLAFLIYNINPAKIFLGDSGSTFVGFTLAVTSIYVSWADNNWIVAFSAPIMVLFIPVFDLIYTTISRIKNGLVKNLYDWLVYTGKDHIHHRIMSIGFSVNETVLIITLVNLICGLIAVNIVVISKEIELIISYFQIFALFTILTLFMRKGRDNV
ncbi:MAG: undecaprenyl/decaprenyl-phosphate alpha-N-acetylglucosaminyl 1-phosphate transferase, partial [Elusimicrobiales bacterium]|nr:undecaprenyl/decaprenyl-phosphate alpha-N-acetylglucosaminyl 1-phosphate transferase [Elusimicrobiales bacterium]